MLTYQVRPHVLKIVGNKEPQLPGDVEVTFHCQPLQPFGMEAGGGLTTVQSKAASVFFNANTGQHFVESKEPLKPLEVTIEEPDRKVSLLGNRLTIRQQFGNANALREFIESVYFGLPLLLSVDFADPVRVERVDGRIEDVEFRWELSDWRVEIDITTQNKQEERFASAWSRFDVVSPPDRRRLLGALHYFYVACRLRREEKLPGEFLAEALLNLNKVLEVLYGPNREAVRSSLQQLGFGELEIERDFIPVMLLRNSIDVGHPSLALFTLEQLTTLHRYADRAERVFRTFLGRLLEAVEGGRLTLPRYELTTLNADTQQTIEIIRARLESLDDHP
jgi:hypothetical protein